MGGRAAGPGRTLRQHLLSRRSRGKRARTPRSSSIPCATIAESSRWKSTVNCWKPQTSSAWRFPTTRAIRVSSRISSRAPAAVCGTGVRLPSVGNRAEDRDSGDVSRCRTARLLVKFAEMTRNLKGNGLDEGASARLLVHAGKLIQSGVDPVAACTSAVSQALTDDPEMLQAVNELGSSVF